MLEEGATCFVLCPKNSWIPGVVESWDGKTASVRPCEPFAKEPILRVPEGSVFVARDDVIEEDVDDLLNLTVLHDSTLVSCLRRRFARNVIYTNIGAIVVAINPFKFDIPHYMDDRMCLYLDEGDIIEKNLPHSWAVAHNTYFEMRNDKSNQCVLVSGESGAGKTEASKIVMKYLAAISCKEGSENQKEAGALVGKKINLTSPALECFGNAKTVRNDNSSRFGKFMQVKFDTAGFLIGANIVKYLLEKSRIVTAAVNERCYHSLYLVCRSNWATKFNTENDKEFRVLTSGNCLNNKEFDTASDFDEVNEAMSSIGVDQHELDSIWSVVASVLHLGNVEFEEDGEGSQVSQKSHFSLASGAALLRVDVEGLQREFTKTTLTVAGQTITKLLKPTLATDAKEALMKALYDAMFQWLVDKCNAVLDVAEYDNWIGLLDIFGFESFEVNSFEQLCINLTNESLQHHYNTYIFEKDLEECRSEGIDMSMVAFPDNAGCIHMISAKGGILSLLDEECSLGKGTDASFLEKVTSAHQGNPFFQRKPLQKTSFTIIHYAGDVSYEVSGFLDKNRDTIKDAFRTLVGESADPWIARILSGSGDSRKTTVGQFFKNQLKDLLDVLNSTNPHWIRCIKPHPAKKPGLWHGVNVMNQLSSSGVLGTVKIRKAGFPVRMKIGDFVSRYNVLGKRVEDILTSAAIPKTQAQKGTVRVFLKSEAFVDLEHKKKEALLGRSKTVQAFARGVYDVALIRQRQRILNGALYERLRIVARRLIDVMDEETLARDAVEESLWAARDDLMQSFLNRTKDLLRVIRQRQLDKQREEFERRQREEAARVERERVLAQRREAAERRKREEEERINELKRLQSQVESVRRERSSIESAEAAAVQAQMERFLMQKHKQFLAEQEAKRVADRMKAEEVRLRRKEVESKRQKVVQLIANRTEHLQRRGEVLKAAHEFETMQQREEHRLRMAMRRQEAALKLQAEQNRREAVLAVQSAVSDARCTFLKTLKQQLQRDSEVRNHMQHIERHEEDIDADLTLRKELRRKTPSHAKDVDDIRHLQKRLTQKSIAASAAFERVSHDTPPRETPSAKLTTLMTERSIVAGVKTPVRSTREARRHRDTNLPPPIDPTLLSRLSGKADQIVMQYGTTAVAPPLTYSVPWRI